MRICSLLPSATEIVCAIGLEDSLVGISHECDFPPSVRSRPALIRPRVSPEAPAQEIDRQVRELISRGESIYSVDVDLLLRLRPDLILTQDLCHVCAASPGDLATALARAPRPPRVVCLSPHSLLDVWNGVRAVGDATGERARADNLVSRLEARIARVAQAAAAAPGPRPRVACLEWLDPLYAAGHWVPEMIAGAGGADALGRAGEPSFRVSWEQVLEARPDFILISPCGYGAGKAAREFRGLALPREWNDLPAVRARRVYALDANSYVSRPGPRLVDGMELMGELFRPGQRVGPALPEGSVPIAL